MDGAGPSIHHATPSSVPSTPSPSAAASAGLKTALITGITGQDGSYLAELLIEKNYFVYGIIRRGSSFNTGRLEHIFNHPRLKLFYGDLTDSSNLCSILSQTQPDEIYNLAAQSHVKVSFEMPEYTANVDGLGTLRLLDAIRACGLTKKSKFYQASTSELYGKVQEIPQTEKTPFYPRSPYGCAKLFAYWTTINYREAYSMFACNGILFNHESPRRGPTFVSRKITRAVARIRKGIQDVLLLGNLDAKRDWGHAKDYVRAMWMMMQHDVADDFVIATGESHSVREFCELSFAHIGITLKWRGEGVSEEGYDEANGKVLIKVDERYFRPTEVDFLLGCPAKAMKELKWTVDCDFQSLVRDMVDGDIALVESGDLRS